jgi:hypothetical protein
MRCWHARASAPFIRSSLAGSRRMRWPAASRTVIPVLSSLPMKDSWRRTIPLKANTDKAIEIAAKDGAKVKKVLVVRRTAGKIDWVEGRDVWYHQAMAEAKPDCKPERMKAEDPLFILYTSGSTGKPKGVLHTTGGYLVWASMTHEYVFDYHEGDIYWCTADVGWVTGHSYIVYGPLANGAITLMFEGVPTYPDAGRFWDVCDKHKVNIFYTAPTAIRALMGAGDDYVNRASLKDPSAAGFGGRADQPGSLGVVLQCRRQEEVLDCRYLVADRNRRDHDHAAGWRDRSEAGLGNAAVLRRAAATG